MRSALEKASKRKDTISLTHKDKPTWSPILVTISHFHIFTSQNCGGLACFTMLLEQKQLPLREGYTDIIWLEGREQSNCEKMYLHNFVSFLKKEITS